VLDEIKTDISDSQSSLKYCTTKNDFKQEILYP